jgi:hypothetical protein
MNTRLDEIAAGMHRRGPRRAVEVGPEQVVDRNLDGVRCESGCSPARFLAQVDGSREWRLYADSAAPALERRPIGRLPHHHGQNAR